MWKRNSLSPNTQTLFPLKIFSQKQDFKRLQSSEALQKMREFLEVDPMTLHITTQRRFGADPSKYHRQVARFGKSTEGMPLLIVLRGTDGELVIFDGVTRARRIAKLLPGRLVRVEVTDRYPVPVAPLPTIKDKLP